MPSRCRRASMAIASFCDAGTPDIDLRALHVELCAWVVGCCVERDDLCSQKIPNQACQTLNHKSYDHATYCPAGTHAGSTKSTLPLLLYSLVTAHSPLLSMPSSYIL